MLPKKISLISSVFIGITVLLLSFSSAFAQGILGTLLPYTTGSYPLQNPLTIPYGTSYYVPYQTPYQTTYPYQLTYINPSYSYPQYSYPQYSYPQYSYPQYSYPQYSYPQYSYPQYSYPQYINGWIDQSANGKTVRISLGKTLAIILPSNITTGYQWKLDTELLNSSIVSKRSSQFIAPATTAQGASGYEQWIFYALRRGTTTIKLDYIRYWETTAVNTFEVEVIVE